ncbi:MAG: phage holin family protein [Chloroflexi bacterium]|nr:phage holin family protein [Chloroflexota bacterium]
MKKPQTALAKRPIIRILVIWIIQTAALLIMAWLMDSVTIASVGAALAVTAVIGLLNALLWPLLSYFLVPFAVLTLGIGALLMNGLIVWLASEFVDGFDLVNFWSAFWLALGMAAINIILSTLLTIDDDNSWYRNQVKRRMKRIAKPEETNVPGVFFLEIDGLSLPVLQKALAEGFAPTLKRWLDSGSHVLTGWETDTSSQTSASQAGILHGNNSNIPAFRWYDKESGNIVASSDTKILPVLEKGFSDGNGLLSDDGASRGNLFSGDAPYVMNTASTLLDRTRFHTSEFQAYFANPYNVSRTLLLFLWDVFLEKRQFRQARKNNVRPILDRHHRGGVYPLIRSVMTVLMRELNIYTLLGDVFGGRPSAYATFVGYDEIAHHSGVLDPGAFDVLYKLDEQFARLESAIEDAPRPYHLVVLSDHGQTGGATFLQRYGKTLQEFVQELMTTEYKVDAPVDSGESYGVLNAFLTDTITNEASGATKMVGRVFKSKTMDGEVMLGPKGHKKRQGKQEEDEEKPAVIAIASGNLGIVSFTQWSERATLEQLETTFPAVIPGLAQHEGIGFIMVRSETHGPVVMGANGIYYLKDDRIEGENPLANFGDNAADHLRRTDSFPNCPDILANSFYDPETYEGCAFEELIGFHGGMGGPQTQPFILHPAELKAEGELVGAAAVYHTCKGWLNQLHNS